MIPWAAAAVLTVVWAVVLGWGMLDAGCRAARWLGISTPASTRLLAGVVLAASGLWLWLMLLAAFGALGPRSAAVGVVVAFAALRARDPAPHAIPTGRLHVLLLGQAPQAGLRRAAIWLLATTAALVLAAGLEKPVFEFDALSYHLPFTARVLDTGTIPHVDTPFGDPAAAYQPKVEHVLRALLVPVPGHEQLVWIGAFPHLLLLWLGVYVGARSLGAGRTPALWGVASTLLATVTLSQAADSLVDLPVAAWWTAFAALLLAWRRTDDHGVALPLVAGLALGLAFGAKYLAVALAPLLALVLLPVLAERRKPAGWLGFAAGVLATGGFFYLRNLVWTGNPAYPVHTELFGQVLFDGPIARSSMFDWVFNMSRTDDGPLSGRLAVFLAPLLGSGNPDGSAPPFYRSAALALVPTGLWVAGCAAQSRRAAGLAFAAIAPAALVLCWYAVPFTYGRFALVATAAVGITAATAGRTRRTTVLLAVAVTGGLLVQFALAPGRWHDIVATALLLAAIAAFGSAKLPPRARKGFGSVALTVGVATACVAAASNQPRIFRTTPNSWRPGLALVEALPDDARVAYAGNNVPYVLRGNARRDVRHIPLDGDLAGRFDTRARRWQESGLAPAISPSPGFDRGVQDPNAWLQALREARIDTLVVTALGGVQLVQTRHDARGFPVEEHWARAAAPALELLHSDDTMSVYAVHRDREPAASLPAVEQRREPDAFALLPHARALTRHYPLGVREIGKPQYARVRDRVGAMVKAGVGSRGDASR